MASKKTAKSTKPAKKAVAKKATAKKATAKKATTRSAKSAKKVVRHRPTKGGGTLEDFIVQGLSDPAFAKALKKDPAAALKANGYPITEALVRQIKNIDFDVFWKTLPRRGMAAKFGFC